MRRLIEEYGAVLLYVITGIMCITLFSLAFFGEGSSISQAISDSIDNTANSDISIVYTITYDGLEGANFGGQTVPSQYTKEDRVIIPQPQKDGYLFAGWVGTRISDPTINVIIPEGSTGNRSYTATWTKGYYRIVYDSNVDYMANKYKTLENITEEMARSWMSGSTESYLAEYGVYPTLKNSGFSFLGHKFKGWNTKPDGTGTAYPAGTTATSDLLTNSTVSWVVNDIKLYAQWEEIVYTIDYVHANQAVDLVKNNENPSTYKVTNTLSLRQGTDPNPVLKGYTFGGWYTRDPYLNLNRVEYRFDTGTGSNHAYDKIMPGTTGNLTLYSYFTANNYTIRFVMPDYTAANKNAYFEVKKTYNVDVTLEMPKTGTYTKAPTKQGYDFLGWQVSPALTDVSITGSIENKYLKLGNVLTDEQVGYVEADYRATSSQASGYVITLFPVFGPHQYFINYIASGGTNAPSPQVKTYGIDIKLKDETNGSANKEDDMVRPGYTFEGWIVDKCEKHNAQEIFYKVASAGQNDLNLKHDLVSEAMTEVTLRAKWKNNEYKVTFDLNIPMQDNDQPGFAASEVKNYIKEATVTFDKAYGTAAIKDIYLSSNDSKPAQAYKYRFDGWFTEPECLKENEITSESIVKIPDHHTLYAKWTPVTYIIRLHSNF